MILETGKLLQQRGTIMSESKGMSKIGGGSGGISCGDDWPNV